VEARAITGADMPPFVILLIPPCVMDLSPFRP